MRRELLENMFRVGLVILMAAALVVSTIAIVVVGSRSQDTCTQVQALKAQIVQTLERSKKGLPSNMYYQHHPVELARAIKDVKQGIREFQPTKC